MQCKNKHFHLKGYRQTSFGDFLTETDLEVIVTNDNIGKTITVNDGTVGFTFPADSIAPYLK